MNYYIQGNKEKADQIKAAFGKYVSTQEMAEYDFSQEEYLFYTGQEERGTFVYAAWSDSVIAEIIKTHPDYKELELPIEPKSKFKVWDWIVQNDNGTVSQITKTINGKDEYGEYRAYEHTNGYFAACFENEFHLWTIQDAKDGDVLATDNGWTCIFKAFDGWVFSSYCFMDSQKWFCEFGSEAHTPDSKINGNIHPATKEQHELLFKKIKEAGYQWDSDNKELHKIQPHYDITNFHAGMPVLVRETSLNAWQYVLFSHCYIGGDGLTRFNAGLVGFTQCIPFEGNEHLLGTTDMCPEEYINW